MNIQKLISTPPPDAVWQVDKDLVVAVHRNRRGEDRCGAAELPEDALEVGPAGIRSVDREKLRATLETVQQRVGENRRAAVVIPTCWVRIFLFEGEDLPKRASDLEDVVRWRLKKLLPGASGDARLVAVMQPQIGNLRQALCVTAPDRAMSDLEAAFDAIGVWPGLVLPRLFALSLDSAFEQGAKLVVQQEDGMLALMLIHEGGVRLVRSKLLAAAGGGFESVERDLDLALIYIREQLGIEDRLEVGVSTADSQMAACIGRWLGTRDGVAGRILGSGACSDATLAGLVGPARLTPMAAVLTGGAP